MVAADTYTCITVYQYYNTVILSCAICMLYFYKDVLIICIIGCCPVCLSRLLHNLLYVCIIGCCCKKL